ncbi:MAG: GTPase ObgE, partial [Oscillospiraceae bacterium]|nr:GTPase ObgE [Oscillospiraceae bacterium]
FHREKYVASGGPDGGDGGKGGDVVFKADTNLSTLADFRYKRKYEAAKGENGGSGRKSGKSAPDLIICVPQGTLVKDAATGRLLADVSGSEPIVIAKGGKGGWGNTHFATPTRQAPRFSKPGLPGESFELQLELKLLADVGIVGFPNVGKSTFVSVVSNAKPIIANYHFTTITPVLGVVEMGPESSFVIADVPGLIEGAADGTGLGHQFLRHIERCRLFLHMVDVAGSEGRDPKADFEAINAELFKYNEQLKDRPMIVVGNKCDLCSDEEVEDFRAYVEEKGYEFYPIMAAIKHNVEPVLKKIQEYLSKLPPILTYEPEPLPSDELANAKHEVKITKTDDVFFVEADWLLHVFRSINFDDIEGLNYFQRLLESTGINDELKAAGIAQGDTVVLYDMEFEYEE